MDTLLSSQPESYSQLIKRSLRLYRASFARVIVLAFLMSVIVFIPRIISDIVGQDIFLNLSPFSPHRFWLFLIDIAALIFFIAIIWRMHSIIHHLNEPIAEDFNKALKKIASVFIAAIIQSAIILATAAFAFGIALLLHQYNLISHASSWGLWTTGITMILQFLLIVYVFTLFFFYVPLIAIENKSILGAMERSVSLVWNHWWRTFSTQLTPWLYYMLLLVLLRYVLHVNVHIYFVEHVPHSYLMTILQLILFALFIPWVAALLIVQLKDLELRKHILNSNL